MGESVYGEKRMAVEVSGTSELFLYALGQVSLYSPNIRAWNSLRKRGFSRKWKSKIAEQNIFCEKKNPSILFSMKIKMMDLWMQTEGTKLKIIMNFSVLNLFKFASRMPQIAQILISTFKIFSGEGGCWNFFAWWTLNSFDLIWSISRGENPV